MPHDPRGSEAARPKINLLKSSRTRGPGGAPFVPGMHPVRAGWPRCWDSTLVAWYPSVYAPRTGGAYDSHHRTAGIAGCGAAAAWPLADRMRRIGVLMNRAADNPEGQTRLAAFMQGLQEAGWDS